MSQSDVRIEAKSLQTFTQAVFEKAGMPARDATVEAEVLVWANLRGIDSHGVLRIPSYLDFVDQGWMNPTPEIRVLKETAAILYMDGDRAFGPVVTVPAMKQVIAKAKAVGIGWGLLRNITHQGAMAYYSLMAAEAGMAGIAIVCSPPNMAPFGARASGLHNSPIAIAVPAGRHPPLVVDMATSVAAGGKLTLAADKGVPLGDDWALDTDGNPTTDPALAKILRPAGGPKGSGLALMFQTLTSLMANNPLLVPVLQGADLVHNQNSVVAAIDISIFSDLGGFMENTDTLIDELKALPPADGFTEILMPGEPEQRTFDDRSANGIPLPPGTVDKLRYASERFNLPLPDGIN